MLDLIFYFIIILSALFGVVRGFTRIVVKTAAWMIAAWAAFQFGGLVALHLSDNGGPPTPTQTFGGYALMFLFAWICVGIVGAILQSTVSATQLTGLDRLLGLFLGVIRGAFICSLITLVLGFTALPMEPEWRHSTAVSYISPISNWMYGQLAEWQLLHSPVHPEAKDFKGAYHQLFRREIHKVATYLNEKSKQEPTKQDSSDQHTQDPAGSALGNSRPPKEDSDSK